jgi:hypothetical protein
MPYVQFSKSDEFGAGILRVGAGDAMLAFLLLRECVGKSLHTEDIADAVAYAASYVANSRAVSAGNGLAVRLTRIGEVFRV